MGDGKNVQTLLWAELDRLHRMTRAHPPLGHDSGRVLSSRGDGSSGAPTSVSGSIILLTVTCFLLLVKLIAMLRHVLVPTAVLRSRAP